MDTIKFSSQSVSVLSPNNSQKRVLINAFKKPANAVEEEPVAAEEESVTFSAPTSSTTKKRNILPSMSAKSVWIWAIIAFLVAFGITAGVLAGVNPPAVQQLDTVGNTNGTLDFYKVFGGAAVVGLTVLVIYLLIVLSKNNTAVQNTSS